MFEEIKALPLLPADVGDDEGLWKRMQEKLFRGSNLRDMQKTNGAVGSTTNWKVLMDRVPNSVSVLAAFRRWNLQLTVPETEACRSQDA